MAARVQILNSPGRADVGDSTSSADARVSLKLAASAYHDARHGEDAPRMTDAAGAILLERALIYFRRLTGGEVVPREGAPSALVRAAATRVLSAALSYASTRYGIDACAELTRAAIGELCDASVRYAQAILADDGRGGPDRASGAMDDEVAEVPRLRAPIVSTGHPRMR